MWKKKKRFKSPELIPILLKVVSSKEIKTVPWYPKSYGNLNQPIYCDKNSFATNIEIAFDINIL